ncbi:MAG: hypothetical protein LUD72_12950 [Bacteroidales bacterium]|nr:hypothetical protein [Bacteroidales bacterium]
MADVKVLNEVGATVVINGVEQEKVTVDAGSTVTWEVSKTGYVTQSGSQEVWGNTVLPVKLKRQEHEITFVVTPDDATLTVNGVEQEKGADGNYHITAKYGDELKWSVSKSGYDTKSGTYTVGEKDDTVTIDLSATQVTFEIEVSLED